MPRLKFVSYLSEYHDETAARLAGADPESPMDFDPSRPYPSRRRLIETGTADVVWMCGFLTRMFIDEGTTAVDIAAAPVFSGEAGAVYRTLVVVPVDSTANDLAELEGTRLVINEAESWSGNHALAAHLRAKGTPLPYFGSVFESGSHSASLQAIHQDEADCTALDSSIWGLLPEKLRERLRVVAHTRDWPAPPVSISRRLDEGKRRNLVDTLMATGPDRAVEGFVPIASSAYDEMARHRPVDLGVQVGRSRTG